MSAIKTNDTEMAKVDLRPPKEIVAQLAKIGQVKSTRSALELFILAVFSGLFLAIACVATSGVVYGIENPGVARMLVGLIFPFGLTMIICTGSELFTGNTLILIGVLSKTATIKGMFRNWAIVYSGNFLGCMILAYFYGNASGLAGDGGKVAAYTLKVALNKLNLPWMEAFTLGIFCNFLVTVAVFMAVGAREPFGKFMGAIVPISMFVMSGFEHSVANMYYIPVAVFAKNREFILTLAMEQGLNLSNLSMEAFFMKNLVPVTLGNVVGGLLFALTIWLANGRIGQSPKEEA